MNYGERPITLFTGQFADIPLADLATKASEWGYDGLELACWGEQLDVQKALASEDYRDEVRSILEGRNLGCWTASTHLVSQAICDHPIDERHQAVLPARIWGDGDPEGVRTRAAEELKDTARAASLLGIDTIVGFTGSSIWHSVVGWPPVSAEMVDRGYADFKERFDPIIDVFEEVGVRFALEVHPSEVAFDFWTTQRTLDAIGWRPGFGINFDPSHFVWQFIDEADFLSEFREKIYHVDCKDASRNLNGRNGIMASHLPFGNLQRGWDFVSVGRGDVNWEMVFRTLNDIGYSGPISVEWEDSGMDREAGAMEALAYIRQKMFKPSAQSAFEVLSQTSA